MMINRFAIVIGAFFGIIAFVVCLFFLPPHIALLFAVFTAATYTIVISIIVNRNARKHATDSEIIGCEILLNGRANYYSGGKLICTGILYLTEDGLIFISREKKQILKEEIRIDCIKSGSRGVLLGHITGLVITMYDGSEKGFAVGYEDKYLDKIQELKLQKESLNDFKGLWDTDFDDIWKIKNKNDFLIALNGWLCKKSNYGGNIEKLSDAEKVFYMIYDLEGEVNNGGFMQFFDNSGGKFANETSAALRKIGADKTAVICDKAISALGVKMPTDWEERRAMLDDVLTDEIGEVLSRCDNAFYEYPDNLVELNYQFIMENREKFTR